MLWWGGIFIDNTEKIIILVGIIFGLLVIGGLMIISSSSTIVTIDGVDFSIPAGYEENPDEKLYDESEFGRMDCKMYKDNQNNSILIGVMEFDGINNLLWTNEFPFDGYDTINGKEGKYFTSSMSNYVFVYLEDGKSVIIGANDKSVVSDIMVVKWLVKNLYSP